MMSSRNLLVKSNHCSAPCSSSLCVVVGLLIPSDVVDGLKIDKDANGEAATKKGAKNAVKKSAEDVEIDEMAQIV